MEYLASAPPRLPIVGYQDTFQRLMCVAQDLGHIWPNLISPEFTAGYKMLVVMPPGPMSVPVVQFLRAGSPNLDDLDIERKILARQWMVGVYIGAVAANLGDGHRPHSFTGIELRHLSRAQPALVHQVLDRNPLGVFRIPQPIGILRCDSGAKHVPRSFPFHG